MTARKRKLIEVSLPLEAINREAAREKSIRRGHPSTLHLWWARRPLAAARAVLFAQLVDDPSADTARYPTEADQKQRREELHALIEKLVLWENSNNRDILAEAHKEILDSTGGNPPTILDPFAGGGTIPLEAQRLGLNARASDLNPVAVLINKALIEIPPKFRNKKPVFPGLADSQIRSWNGAEGLAADVQAYGQWVRDEAEKRIGHLYPKATLPDGSRMTVIAWIWARTITCPNPRCGIEIPLVRSWWLSTRKNREAYVIPQVRDGKVTYSIGRDPRLAPSGTGEGTVSGRSGATCLSCKSSITAREVHRQLDQQIKPPPTLVATVVDGPSGREYVVPDVRDASAVEQCRAQGDEIRATDEYLSAPARGTFGGNAQGRRYGFFAFSDYFTDRQLIALTTFSDLVVEARTRIVQDASQRGESRGTALADGGKDALAYADAVATYLGLGVSRLADIANALARWENTRSQVRNLFARQAISMVWDFAEAPPFGRAAGAYEVSLGSIVRSIVDSGGPIGVACQADARTAVDTPDVLISTDPPYYDNIVYSDLSDFFYVWLRRSLSAVWPDLFATLLVPKAEELVANAYRHNGNDGARQFFEEGFTTVFKAARTGANNDFPITVFYAFKQAESTPEGSSSAGWETLLDGMVRSAWMVTGTWPMRSELSNRMVAQDTNALASSVVLALRPRPEDATTVDRRGFISALHDELPGRLRELQHGLIAPVDLPQAAIGPGMAVFSRYAKVLEADGSAMTVRSALARINEVLDQVLSEQEGDFDATTRFAISWYRQHGYATGQFGAADSMARARNTSVASMERAGILTGRAGRVTLLAPAGLPIDYDPISDVDISAWEVLHHLIRLLDSDGVAVAGQFLALVRDRGDGGIDPELVKELAFLMFSIADSNKWTKDAIAFNNIVTSWADVVAASRSGAGPSEPALTLEYDVEDEEV